MSPHFLPGIAMIPFGVLAGGMPNPPDILHNPGTQRFEVTVEGYLGYCEYVLAAGRMTITHTVVAPELRGRGIAELLVRATLAEARAQGRKVVPACSYVAKFIERHAEFQDLVVGD